MLSQIRGTPWRQDGRRWLSLQHLYGASQQRSDITAQAHQSVCGTFNCVQSKWYALNLIQSNTSFTGQAHSQEPPPVVMVDELLTLNPHKLSFSEAGLRIMITPHFSPRTRLSMAGRMLISEVFDAHIRNNNTKTNLPIKAYHSSPQRQRLIRNSKSQLDGEAGPGSRGGSNRNSLKRTESCTLENGGGRPGTGDAESGDNPDGKVCQPPEEDDDEDGIFSPVRIPSEDDVSLMLNKIYTWIIFINAC